MNFAIAFVVILVIVSLIGTILLTGKTDNNYRNSTGKNAFNLTMIYIVVTVASLIWLAWYMW